MFSENTLKTRRRWNNSGVVMCLLLLTIGNVPVVQAQEPPTTQQEIQVRRKSELHTRAKGKVIAEGKNKNASKHVPVEGFTVEELQLDDPVEAEIDGKKTEVYQAYRITVFGGPFDLRAMPLVLMIDDTRLIGLQAPKLDKATFILYDRSLLRDGATLSVGFGGAEIELTDKLRIGEKRQ